MSNDGLPVSVVSREIPALLTSTSMRPKWFFTQANAETTLSSWATLHSTACNFPEYSPNVEDNSAILSTLLASPATISPVERNFN